MLEEEVANLKEELHLQGMREERSSVAAVRAERESHTLSARTVALQEQLVATEEKVAAEKMRKDALHSELGRASLGLSILLGNIYRTACLHFLCLDLHGNDMPGINAKVI